MFIVKREDFKEITDTKRNVGFSSALVEEVVSALDIFDFIQTEYGVMFNSFSKEWFKTQCPLPGHRDSTPSFGVNQEKQIYNCFGCQRKGNIIQLVRDMEGATFFEAVTKLAVIAGISEDNGDIEIQRTIRTVDRDVDEFLNRGTETELPAGVSSIQFMFMVAKRMREFEEKWNYDEKALEFTENIYKEFDKYWEKENHKEMDKVWRGLAEKIRLKSREIKNG